MDVYFQSLKIIQVKDKNIALGISDKIKQKRKL